LPTAHDHKNQFERNKSSISAVGTLQDPPNDWIITMAFYAAVHLIEGVLVEKLEKGSGDHKTRRRLMGSVSQLRPIGPKYATLEDYSHKSRYKCKTFQEDDVTKILGFLNDIEQHLKTS